jgi:hypothetical protein
MSYSSPYSGFPCVLRKTVWSLVHVRGWFQEIPPFWNVLSLISLVWNGTVCAMWPMHILYILQTISGLLMTPKTMWVLCKGAMTRKQSLYVFSAGTIFYFWIFTFFNFWDNILLCTPGWPWIVVFLPQLSECWDYRQELPHPAENTFEQWELMSFWVGEHPEVLGGWCTHLESVCGDVLCTSSVWMLLHCVFLCSNASCMWSVSLSFESHSTKLLNLRKGSREPQFIARLWGPDLWLTSQGGTVCGIKHLNLQGLMTTPGR